MTSLNKPLSILAHLSDSDKPYLATVDELSEFCAELEERGKYQILAWRRDADRGGQIEFTVTYEDEPARAAQFEPKKSRDF